MTIELTNVTKAFGTKIAVDDLTLAIPRGEFFAFLGPNGAGKTTTIKIITGLLKTTKGDVKVSGFDVNRDYIKVKNIIGYVPDQPYIYDKLSGREFLNFVGTLYDNMPAKELDYEIAKYIELFGMSDYADELAETYSHGMKQRLILSATLMHKPQIIVVDEPLVGLDPQTSRLVKKILKDQTKNGCTIFMSTHVLSIAEETADRIGIINNGKLIALGTIDELKKITKSDGKLEDLFFNILATPQV